MIKSAPLLILWLAVKVCFVAGQDESPMRVMLNAMQQMMTGEDFDDVFYEELRTCMDFIDNVTLSTSQDSAWQGIIDYWNTNGNYPDFWGSYQTNYVENNISCVTEVDQMVIYEPCNYASNVAYYHVVTELCGMVEHFSFTWSPEYVMALVRAFSIMAMGSAFMHGSHTELGHQQDVTSMELVSYAIHQGSLSSIKTDSPILHDLAETHRELTAIQLIDDVTLMYTELYVNDWYEYVDALDMPGYYRVFAAIFTTCSTLIFEEDDIDYYLPLLLDLAGVPTDDQDFILNYYLPELRNETIYLNIPPDEKVKFTGNVIGSVSKLVYALLWQEGVIDLDILLASRPNNLDGSFFLT